MKPKIFKLLEYLLFLIIPLSIFFYLTIRNKKRIDNIEVQKNTHSKNIVKQKSPEETRLINLGLLYINQKKYKESINAYLKVLSINPNNTAAVYNNIGFAYGSLKQWDKGIEYCSKATYLNPNFQLAKNNLKWMQREKAALKKD